MSPFSLRDGRVVRLYGYQAHFIKSPWPERMPLPDYKRLVKSRGYLATTQQQIERFAHSWGSMVHHISHAVPKFIPDGETAQVELPEWINLVLLKSAPLQGNVTIPGRKLREAMGSQMIFVWFTKTGPDGRSIGKTVSGLLMDSSWDQLAQDYKD